MNKKQLYESIMKNIAKEVKKALNETSHSFYEIPDDAGLGNPEEMSWYEADGYKHYYYFGDCVNTVYVDKMWNASEMAGVIQSSHIIPVSAVIDNISDGDRHLTAQFKKSLKKLKDTGKIGSYEDICAAINARQGIMFIYITELDTHFFFDCEGQNNVLDDRNVYSARDEYYNKDYDDED